MAEHRRRTVAEVNAEIEEHGRRVEAAVRSLMGHGDAAREAILWAGSALAELEGLGDVELFDGVEGSDIRSELENAALSMRHVRRIIEARATLLDEDAAEDDGPQLEAIGKVIDQYNNGDIQPTDALGEIYRMFPGGQVAAS